MSRFVEGQDRRQSTLLPSCLDDYVGEDNPARVIDVFVDELEAAIEAMQRRIDLAPQSPMKLRRRIVEHPFGTIKAWMGSTHFLMKRLANVKTLAREIHPGRPLRRFCRLRLSYRQ